MQKVEVQMSPKPYDTKRIFCSQGDTELRKFGFILKDGISNVDITDISDPVFTSFPVSAGGTEELLPTSTSTPATSPIVADIRYPDGLRQEESFTYRESPTTVSGNAKLKALYGNSIAWNQLELNDGATTTSAGTTYTNNGDGTWSLTGTPTGYSQKIVSNTHVKGIVGHKYLFMGCPDTNQTVYAYRPYINGASQGSRDYGKGIVLTCTTESAVYGLIVVSQAMSSINVKFTPMIIDLTLLGMDDVTDKESFLNYFPLPSYQFDSGSLLDFKGTGIKTVGKNLLESQNVGSLTRVTISVDNGVYTLNGASANYQQSLSTTTITLQKGTYTLNSNGGVNNTVGVQLRSVDGLTTYANSFSNASTFTLEQQTTVKFRIVVYANTTFNNYIMSPQLEIGSSASDYEPYTESTLSLPISTYFPTGMKSAGSVRDELTDNKAIPRVNQITIDGTLGWFASADNVNRFGVSTSLTPSSNVLNRQSNYLQVSGWATGSYQFALRDTGAIYVCLDANGTQMTLDEFKAYMNAHPLTINFELATSSEESIMSASLVTNDAEVPLYKEDDLMVGDCTEELSKTVGIKTCKIRFTDADGDCYSNKIKLSVEERP